MSKYQKYISQIIKMDRDNSFYFSSAVKQQYLPPPLEESYLSLLDIQVKAAKELLHGNEQQKIAIIKKRIKKFFDYGNDDHQDSDLNFNSVAKNKSKYPPFQFNKNFNQGLEIDRSQIIFYGEKSVSFEIAKKILPGFIGSQKIDDCNIKLAFASFQECQNCLRKAAKNKGFQVTESNKFPKQIQWFEIELKTNKKQESICYYFARYVTNKDDILFKNDNYFRKLLGKARQIIDQKEQQQLQRQQELKQIKERKVLLKKRKIFQVKRNQDKQYLGDFDKMTNYDGVYSDRSYQKFQNSRQVTFYDSGEDSWYYGGRQKQKEKKNIDRLDISSIKFNKAYRNSRQQDHFKRERYRQTSSESVGLIERNQKKKKSIKIEDNNTKDQLLQNPRQKIIKAYREKSIGRNLRLREVFDDYDYDKEIEKKIARQKKPQIEIDYSELA